jgi:threonine synthase
MPSLYLKDEARNPTWSYKDRLAAVAVTKAVEAGAETVVVATTGNHGAAAAAYAAAAGLRCVALTLASVPLTMKVLMQVYGARLVALRSGPERWALMGAAVAERSWVPLSGYLDPPVGSNPFGIDGYKTIAYELVEELDAAPDVVVVPTAYGDGLVGIYRGFLDLRSAGTIAQPPRMVAAEPLGPYAATLATGGEEPVAVDLRPSVAFSTATPVATFQGIHALRSSDGAAVAVPDDELILGAQRRFAELEGVFLEAAAALTLPVVERLLESGWIHPGERVVLIGTSSGLKDVEATASTLTEVPIIDPFLDALDAALDRLGEL